MLKHLFTLMFCSMTLPSAMAADITYDNQYNVIANDDDDDDNDEKDDKHIIAINRPEVSCSNISRKSADVTVKVRARNKTNKKTRCVVSLEIKDNKGNTVAKVNDKIMIPANLMVVSKSTVTLKDPHLHSAERGYRYKVEAEVVDNKGEEISAEKSSKFVIAKGNSTIINHARKNASRKHPGNNLKMRNSNMKLVKTAK